MIPVKSLEAGIDAAKRIGYPVLVFPHFALNGHGAGAATNEAELRLSLSRALNLSPTHEASIIRREQDSDEMLVVDNPTDSK